MAHKGPGATNAHRGRTTLSFGVQQHRLPGGLTLIGALGALGGAVLFAWSIQRAGPSAVVDGVRRLGVGFIGVFLLGGIRHLAHTLAWTLCVEPPAHLPLGRAFVAYLAGDSLGNVTPFGALLSEPSKIILIRHRVPPQASIAALTVENLLYSATVVVVLTAGTAALLLAFQVPEPMRIMSLAVFAGAAAMSLAAAWVVVTRRRVISRLVEQLIRRDVARSYLRSRLPHVADIEDRVFGFVGRRPGRAWKILAIEIVHHVAAVIEIWVALRFITGVPPSVLAAFVLEYVNRTITLVFKFVPLQLGVDEAGTSLITTVLQLGPAAGVSLALARKGRVSLWTAIGLVLLLWQGLSLKDTVREAQRLRW